MLPTHGCLCAEARSQRQRGGGTNPPPQPFPSPTIQLPPATPPRREPAQVPVFKAVDTADIPVDYTGLARGGQQVSKARSTFSKCVETLIQLATLQTSFLILDEVCKQSLEHIP